MKYYICSIFFLLFFIFFGVFFLLFDIKYIYTMGNALSSIISSVMDDSGFIMYDSFVLEEQLIDPEYNIYIGVADMSYDDCETFQSSKSCAERAHSDAVCPSPVQCIRVGQLSRRIYRLLRFDENAGSLMFEFEDETFLCVLSVDGIGTSSSGKWGNKIILNFKNRDLSFSKEMNAIVRKTFRSFVSSGDRYVGQINSIGRFIAAHE